MAKVKFELNRTAVRDQLLRSEAMMGICRGYAEEIAGRCGEGYASDTHKGRNRVNAMVYPQTPKAMRSNLKHNTLLKAVGK